MFQSAALLNDSALALYWCSTLRDNQSHYVITEHVIVSGEVCLGCFQAAFTMGRICGTEIIQLY
jgi:hypothetical protein